MPLLSFLVPVGRHPTLLGLGRTLVAASFIQVVLELVGMVAVVVEISSGNK